MQNSQVLHQPKDGGKPRNPPMQKPDASWQARPMSALLLRGPESRMSPNTNSGHSSRHGICPRRLDVVGMPVYSKHRFKTNICFRLISAFQKQHGEGRTFCGAYLIFVQGLFRIHPLGNAVRKMACAPVAACPSSPRPRWNPYGSAHVSVTMQGWPKAS